ncbi:MAG TPA: ATPase, T2SS/T4P/T4SS family [Paenalcaligenes sp.]|nr:ATPase, T2SS/T4P/T4SS family [Paenalcaligenes sp.]
MLRLELEYQSGELSSVALEVPCVIGRQAPADLLLKGWRVAKSHAEIVQIGGNYFIKDLGSLTGTVVNDSRITEYGPLQGGDRIVIGPCQLTIARIGEAVERAASFQEVDSEVSLRSAQQNGVVAQEAKLGVGDCGDPYAELVGPLHQKLLAALDLRRKTYRSEAMDSLREQAVSSLRDIVRADACLLDSRLCEETLLARVVDEALGLGPLELLLRDDSVSEVMVNSPSEVFVERHGKCEQSALQFSSEAALLAVIDRIVSPIGRRIDDSSPMVDARLPDGSRVNAVLPPIALKGPTLTVRKFPLRRLSHQDLLAHNALSPAMLSFLQACVVHKKNMLVSGGTGSGKTTLLNVLATFVAPAERIITIEDAAELKLEQPNLVKLEARPANTEGKGVISIRDLVRNALRMRPDRIVVGECRGGEAFDMLAAMNTGHEGSMTTLHANSPREALNRLETLVMLAGMDLPLSVVRDHIATSVDIIVQQTRLANGQRIISSITEICGQEGGRILLQELFQAQIMDGGHRVQFKSNGLFPQSFANQPEAVCADWFQAEAVLS